MMRHLSALKKQYKEDLEELTRSYEAKRKALKDAIMTYANTIHNSRIGSHYHHNKGK